MLAAVATIATLAVGASAGAAPIRIAVLDFGANGTGSRAAAAVRQLFANSEDSVDADATFAVLDSDMAKAAAAGAGFHGSLNLTTQEARDIGAAIGCDFYVIGDAQTLRRTPSTGAAYFDSFASIFIVSARSGRLVFWQRPLERRETAAEAERTLLQVLAATETRNRYRSAIKRAFADERSERESAVGKPESVIDVMSEDDTSRDQTDVRPPRPFRRFKPPYPESAAVAEVEAVVDVLVDIDVRGEISNLEIARWAGYGLDQAVIDTVRQMHFFPAMRGRVAVPMRVLLRYNFRKPPK